MTRKEELIQELKTQHLDKMVIFVEDLDDGRRNFREMFASRSHIISLIEEYFDDNLHGHFKDKIMTTILNATYQDKLFEETQYKE